MNTWTNEEIDAMLQKQEEIVQQCQKEDEEIYATLGITPDELHEFINDRSRFTSEAWDAMENERAKIDPSLHLQTKHADDTRKKTTLVSRKNWIFIK